MLVDFLAAIEATRDFLNTFGEGKEFALLQRECALVIREFMQFDLLPSTYQADDASPNYAILIRGIAEEAARLKLLGAMVRDDLYFCDTRGEFINQTIGSYITGAQRFRSLGFPDTEYREFLKAILGGFFGGATKTSIEAVLSIFPGDLTDPNDPTVRIPIGLVEILLEAVKAGLDPDIATQWFFGIDVSDPDLIDDVNQFLRDLKLIIDLVKPAHTLPLNNFIFKEGGPNTNDPDGIFSGTTDAFREDIFFYEYDDMRENCFCLQTPVEVIDEDVTLNFIFPSSPLRTRTAKRPLVKSDGVLAEITDVSARTISGPLVIADIDPLTGEIELASAPPIGEAILVTYKHQPGLTFVMTLNNPALLLNQSINEPFGDVPFGATLNGVPPKREALTVDYRWRAWELPNSSLLNESRTLVLNGNICVGNKLNFFNEAKSKGFDRGEFNVTLNDGTPLFPLTQTRVNLRQELKIGFILNDLDTILNDPNSLMFDRDNPPSDISRQLSRLDDIFGSIEIERVLSGGEDGLLSTMCDNGPQSLEFRHSDDYVFPPEVDCKFLNLNNPPSGTLNGDALIGGGEPCKDGLSLIQEFIFSEIFDPITELEMTEIVDFLEEQFFPEICPDNNFILNNVDALDEGSLLNEDEKDSLLAQLSIPWGDDWIELVFSSPAGTFYIDGTGLLVTTPLHTP